jgi:hypothetical protein
MCCSFQNNVARNGARNRNGLQKRAPFCGNDRFEETSALRVGQTASNLRKWIIFAHDLVTRSGLARCGISSM